jgi:membrane protease YdiL (CAAX protease family)
MTMPPPASDSFVAAPVPPAPFLPPQPTPRPLPADAVTGGLAFHRLVFARRRNGWWTPLVTGVLGVALYAAMMGLLMAAFVLLALAVPEVADRLFDLGADISFDLTDPVLVAVLLLTIVLMLPAYVLASLIVNGRKVGFVSSAAGRLRWRWLLACIGVATLVAVVLTGLSLLLPSDPGDTAADVVPPAENPALWATLLVLLVFVPLQAAAEEYVFRGYLMQAIGRWLRHPAFAILLPVPLFVLGHLYDPLGQAGVGVFAVAAGVPPGARGPVRRQCELARVDQLRLLGAADRLVRRGDRVGVPAVGSGTHGDRDPGRCAARRGAVTG